jgi:hypothetical protein
VAEYPPKFEQFWQAYPRKVAKVNALKAWAKQGCEADMYMGQAAIDDAEKRTRLKWWSSDASKIPHPSSWINAKRWEDEGWEGETESGKKPMSQNARRETEIKELPPMCWEERVLGRLFVSYCVRADGLPEVEGALRIKHDLLDRVAPDFREEIEAGDMTVAQVAMILAELFVARMDEHYGRSLSDAVLTGVRQHAAA